MKVSKLSAEEMEVYEVNAGYFVHQCLLWLEEADMLVKDFCCAVDLNDETTFVIAILPKDALGATLERLMQNTVRSNYSLNEAEAMMRGTIHKGTERGN